MKTQETRSGCLLEAALVIGLLGSIWIMKDAQSPYDFLVGLPLFCALGLGLERRMR